MLLYLLLIIIFGVVVLVSATTLIYGLVKKQKKILTVAAIFFVVGTIGCAFSALTYTKRVVNYVRSTEFQNDAKKGSELVGETIGSVSSGVSSGFATTLDDESITKLARKSATIVGKSIKTIASSFDSTVGNKNVFLDSSLATSGLELGRVEEHSDSEINNLRIFIDYKKPFKGKLRVTTYDQAGKKIDVSEEKVNSRAGQGKVEIFTFRNSEFGITTYYIVSKGD